MTVKDEHRFPDRIGLAVAPGWRGRIERVAEAEGTFVADMLLRFICDGLEVGRKGDARRADSRPRTPTGRGHRDGLAHGGAANAETPLGGGRGRGGGYGLEDMAGIYQPDRSWHKTEAGYPRAVARRWSCDETRRETRGKRLCGEIAASRRTGGGIVSGRLWRLIDHRKGEHDRRPDPRCPGCDECGGRGARPLGRMLLIAALLACPFAAACADNRAEVDGLRAQVDGLRAQVDTLRAVRPAIEGLLRDVGLAVVALEQNVYGAHSAPEHALTYNVGLGEVVRIQIRESWWISKRMLSAWVDTERDYARAEVVVVSNTGIECRFRDRDVRLYADEGFQRVDDSNVACLGDNAFPAAGLARVRGSIENRDLRCALAEAGEQTNTRRTYDCTFR